MIRKEEEEGMTSNKMGERVQAVFALVRHIDAQLDLFNVRWFALWQMQQFVSKSIFILLREIDLDSPVNQPISVAAKRKMRK